MPANDMVTITDPTPKSAARYLPAIARIIMGLVFLVFVLELYLGWSYRQVYAPMLALRVKPEAD
ncbi:MAG: hypothetical protein ABSH48_16545 [Verrucomicrobiota bacterium]|jgi:hypothetical protein